MIGCISRASDIQSETTVSVELHHQNSVLHDQQARNRSKDATYYLDLGRQLRDINIIGDINRIGGKISLYCVTSSKISSGSSGNTVIEALRDDPNHDC